MMVLWISPAILLCFSFLDLPIALSRLFQTFELACVGNSEGNLAAEYAQQLHILVKLPLSRSTTSQSEQTDGPSMMREKVSILRYHRTVRSDGTDRL